MSYKRIKTEHAGAKNGGGAWMTRAAAKQTAKHKCRQIDKRNAAAGRMRGLFAHIDASLVRQLGRIAYRYAIRPDNGTR